MEQHDESDIYHRHRFSSDHEPRRAIRDYVDFHNHQQLHPALWHQSFADFERQFT